MKFVSTPKTKNALALDLFIAMVPVVLWAVYLFGGRAAVLMGICGGCSFLLDFPVQKLILRRSWEESLSPFAFLTGVLTALWFPVTVPLYYPMIASGFVVIARALYVWFGHRIVCPSAIAAAALGLMHPYEMTRFTKPFAYFNPFEWEINHELVSAYQVKTPFDVLMGGSMYADGVFAQLYGFASGAMGAVAIACLLFGFGWLLYRKVVTWHTTASYLVSLLVLAMAFSPAEVEMTEYGYMYLLCGGIALGAVFPLNDLSITPRTKSGKVLLGMLAAVFTFLFRKYTGGDGVLFAILCAGLFTPLLELFTKQTDYYRLRKKDIVFTEEAPLPSPAEEQTKEAAEEAEAQTNVLPDEAEVSVMDMNEEAPNEQE